MANTLENNFAAITNDIIRLKEICLKLMKVMKYIPLYFMTM